jgi:hypothetical protein
VVPSLEEKKFTNHRQIFVFPFWFCVVYEPSAVVSKKKEKDQFLKLPVHRCSIVRFVCEKPPAANRCIGDVIFTFSSCSFSLPLFVSSQLSTVKDLLFFFIAAPPPIHPSPVEVRLGTCNTLVSVVAFTVLSKDSQGARPRQSQTIFDWVGWLCACSCLVFA